jgi:hypothetical protein
MKIDGFCTKLFDEGWYLLGDFNAATVYVFITNEELFFDLSFSLSLINDSFCLSRFSIVSAC